MAELNFNARNYKQLLEDEQRVLSQEKRDNKLERSRILRKERRLELLKQCIDIIKDLQKEKERLIKENEQILERLQNEQLIIQARERDYNQEYVSLQEQVAVEKRLRTEAEMKLAELNKLSAGMAKKASEEAMLKALRTYANTSKRKTVDKRSFAKAAILELANVNGLMLPDDLAATIESLDDEQPDTKVVNVSGNYNDIHDNATVNQK